MADYGTIDLISIASDVGSIYAGKSKAPAAFGSAGLQDKLKILGYSVKEHKALTEVAGWTASARGSNGARNEARTVAACQQVCEALKSVLQEDHQPSFQLILSGECLYCPAILSAYSHCVWGKAGLIYFDADCDLDTPTDPSSSGNIAGMTLTHLTLREGALESMKQFSKPDGSGVVDNSNIVLFGLNMDSATNKSAQLSYLFDQHFRVFTSKTVQKSPESSAKAALRWMKEQGVENVLVHLDVDVIDPGEFPLSNVPSRTGLEYDNAMTALKTFVGSEMCIGLSIAEVNPDHDPDLTMTRRLVDDVVDGLGSRKPQKATPWSVSN